MPLGVDGRNGRAERGWGVRAALIANVNLRYRKALGYWEALKQEKKARERARIRRHRKRRRGKAKRGGKCC
jgi:hypothetical protein